VPSERPRDLQFGVLPTVDRSRESVEQFGRNGQPVEGEGSSNDRLPRESPMVFYDDLARDPKSDKEFWTN
jgi:hypothetical protein